MKTYFMWNQESTDGDTEDKLPNLPDKSIDCCSLLRGSLIELDYKQEGKLWVNARITGVNYLLDWRSTDQEITQWVWLEPYDDDIDEH